MSSQPFTTCVGRTTSRDFSDGPTDQQVRDAGWLRSDALKRERAKFAPVLEREYADAVEFHHRLWSAKAPGGRSVGWLWVKPIDDMPATSLYLEQITVAAGCRRQGHGRAMLEALEELLAAQGVEEIRLHVYMANEPAQALYAAAGYEEPGTERRQDKPSQALTREVGLTPKRGGDGPPHVTAVLPPPPLVQTTQQDAPQCKEDTCLECSRRI